MGDVGQLLLRLIEKETSTLPGVLNLIVILSCFTTARLIFKKKLELAQLIIKSNLDHKFDKIPHDDIDKAASPPPVFWRLFWGALLLTLLCAFVLPDPS